MTKVEYAALKEGDVIRFDYAFGDVGIYRVIKQLEKIDDKVPRIQVQVVQIESASMYDEIGDIISMCNWTQSTLLPLYNSPLYKAMNED